jgi:SnoaL-like domain
MSDQIGVQAIKDELDIHRVLAEYCLRLEVNTLEDWLDLFTDDTVYEVHRKILRGRKEVAETLALAPHGVHIGGPVRIEREGDTVKTIQSYVFHADEERFSNNGWYYRTLVRSDGGWKISYTVVKMQKRKKPEAPSA